MNVILLTAFLGLFLVGLAIVLFFYTRSCSTGSCPERESLFPLEDDEIAVEEKRDRAGSIDS